MGGSLMQLVAYGAQDVYLTGNPNITFFKIVYRRHTNFSMESIEQYFNGTVNFGRRVQCTVSRNGDLIGRTYLRVVLPEVVYSGDFANKGYVEFAWVRRLGHALIDEVELEIGGSEIDKQYGDWMNIWYELSRKVGQEKGYDQMIGDVPALTDLSSLSWDDSNNVLKPSYIMYVPLYFYFNRNNGLALPLIALQYHEVKIIVRFRRVDELYISTPSFVAAPGSLDLQDASLYIDYIFLDTEERRRFAQIAHEYLIEQIQYNGYDSITNNTLKTKLTYNHPSKGLYWFVRMGNYQGSSFMAYSGVGDWEHARVEFAKKLLLSAYDLDAFGFFNEVTVVQGDSTYIQDGKEYDLVDPASPSEQPTYVFDTDATKSAFDGCRFIGLLSQSQALLQRNKYADLRSLVSGVIRITADSESPNTFYPEVASVTTNDLTMYDLSVPISKYDTDNRNNFIKAFDVAVHQYDNYGLLIDGTINPVTSVQLYLNGHERFSRRDGLYFNAVQPYQHHSNTPKDGLNVYSFAIDPEAHQPSGTCNFSRIDTTQLDLYFAYFQNGDYASVFQDTDNRVYTFTVNYNVLRIMSGMAGTAYSN